MKKKTRHFLSLPPLLRSLWQKHPALFMALALLCGCGLRLHLALLLPLLSLSVLLYAVPSKLRAIGMLLTPAIVGYAAMHISYTLPQDGKEWHGRGLFVIDHFHTASSPFQKFWRYDGSFKWFDSSSHLRKIPATILIPIEKEPPRADRVYLLEGTLKRLSNTRFSFKPKKGSPWTPVKRTLSLAHLRYQAKKAVRTYLKAHLKGPQVADFLSALATGEMENRALNHQFGSLGLQHLLAISGFHFGLLTLACAWLLRLFLSPRLVAILLLALTTIYFFFIGGSPSCFRAWITISLFLIGHIFSWTSSSLNLLGVSLILAILLDPLVIFHLGFQLSYLVTLSILLFFPLCNRALSPLLPPRRYQLLIQMKRLDQHGYILSALTRSGLALAAAVHLFALPMILFLFGKFPLLSLIYNLFLPFAVGISLLLLLFSFIPYLSLPILYLNDLYTSALLTIANHPPPSFQIFLRTPPFSLWALTLYLTLAFWAGLLLKPRQLTESPF